MKKELDLGWISIHRKIEDNWIYPKNREFTRFEAWIDLLLNANHTEQKVFLDKKNKTYLCKRGQQIRSILTLSKKWNWTRSKVRRFLELLQNETMIVLNPDQNTTLITICNYDNYQSDRPTDEQQTNIRRTSDEHQTNINNNVNNDNNVNKEEGIQIRSLTFKASVFAFKDKYPESMLAEFYSYWSEPNKSQKKMLFELKQTFEISRRLVTWSSKNFNRNGSSVIQSPALKTKTLTNVDEIN